MRKNQRKLTARQVVEIVKRYKEGETAPVLASEYGVSPQQIYNIITGRSWDIVTGITEPIRHYGAERSCRICGDTHFAKNYCRYHYKTVYRPRNRQQPSCRICGDRSYAHGICHKHYQQWRALLRSHKDYDLRARRDWGEDRVTLGERNQQIVDRWLKLMAEGQTLWAQPAWGTSHQAIYPEDQLDLAITHFDNKRAKKIAKKTINEKLGAKIVQLCRRTALTIENDVRWALANAYRF